MQDDNNVMGDLVSTDWLQKQLGAADLRVIDATRHHFEPQRDSAAEYREAHIPGALFLDLISLVDDSSPVENTMPTAAQFTQRMRQLGIDGTRRIVIYDDSIVKTAARAWFMFRMFGLAQVAVLDGGLAKWKAEGRPLSRDAAEVSPSRFTATPASGRLRTKHEVLANISQRVAQHVDGRGVAHFTGADPDPDPRVAAGHIPGSINVPFWDLFNDGGTFKSAADLRELFSRAGVDLGRPVTTSCGTGVVACSLALALRLLEKDDVALYDGSWSEWGADPALPKELGPAKP